MILTVYSALLFHIFRLLIVTKCQVSAALMMETPEQVCLIPDTLSSPAPCDAVLLDERWMRCGTLAGEVQWSVPTFSISALYRPLYGAAGL